MKKIKVRLTFNEPILGTSSSDPDIQRRFISSMAPDALTTEEEVAVIGEDAVAERQMTVFPRLTDQEAADLGIDPGCEGKVPFLYDYQIKGFFKDACGVLRNVPGTKSKGIKAYKKWIDGLIFPEPRKIPMILPDGAVVSECQRPLRAQTAQGEHVALANSEECPAGTTVEFEVRVLKDDMVAAVKEWLEYGELRGLGQWRNSGKGRFSVEYLD